MAVTDYDSLIEKLTSRTEKGKLLWKSTVEGQTFIATLEGYTFEVSLTTTLPATVTLLMKDSEDNELVKIDARNLDQYHSEFEPFDRYFARLRALHEEARQSALDVPRKISEVEGLLDRE